MSSVLLLFHETLQSLWLRWYRVKQLFTYIFEFILKVRVNLKKLDLSFYEIIYDFVKKNSVVTDNHKFQHSVQVKVCKKEAV